MKTYSVKIPDRLVHKLELETRIYHVTQSEIIRTALDNYFETHQHSQNNSFFDLAKDLCGCIVGPTDLATNSEHLDDYGK